MSSGTINGRSLSLSGLSQLIRSSIRYLKRRLRSWTMSQLAYREQDWRRTSLAVRAGSCLYKQYMQTTDCKNLFLLFPFFSFLALHQV